MSSTSIFGLEDTATIYHYTTLDALLGIIRPQNIVLWATHYQYLNDKKEILLGLESEISGGIFSQDFFKNLFILSFSEINDNLMMWVNYSKWAGGCVLGFRRNLLRTNMVKCSYSIGDAHKHIDDFNRLINTGSVTGVDERGGFRRVSKDEISNLLDNNNFKKNLLYSSIIGIKDKSFEYEKEVRSFINLEADKLCYIKYRNRNGLIIPYIEIPYEKKFLKEIWLPGSNETTELTKNSIVRLLKQYGYNDVEIKFSNLSYRP